MVSTTWTRLVGGVVACAALCSPALYVACTSDAQTPNANYGSDAVPGTLNHVCTSSNACNTTDLACVDPVGTGLADPTCLALCVQQTGVCADAFRCVALGGSDTDGVCVHIGDVGEPCGVCQDALRCSEGVCLTPCILGGAPCENGGNCETVGDADVCVPPA